MRIGCVDTSQQGNGFAMANTKPRVEPTDFRLIFAPKGFMLGAEEAEHLPILCEMDGTVSEVLVSYFGWSYSTNRVAVSSMRDEAIILREWWAFLANCRLCWDRADDDTMQSWRADMQSVPEAPGPRRIARKLDVVFTFYDNLPAILPLSEELATDKFPLRREFVTDNGPIRRREVRFNGRWHGTATYRWLYHKDAPRGRLARPTPHPQSVANVIAKLRTSPVDPVLGERNWIIGRVESEAGLRREEVSSLSIKGIEAALKLDGIALPPLPAEIQEQLPTRHLSLLDGYAYWEQGKRNVLKMLLNLKKDQRTGIHVRVLGKGNKERSVPFDVDLVRDLLDAVVWGARAEQIRRWAAKCGSYRPSDHIFLSDKTQRRLAPGSIGDLLVDTFKGLNIAGSGHRLRAFFGTHLAYRLWDEK